MARLSRVTLGIAASALIVWAAAALFLSFRAQPQISFARQLVRSEQPDRRQVEEFVETLQSAGWSCRRDIMQAEAALAIYLAESAGPGNGGAVEAAVPSVERLLRCHPYDGMGWLQLSFLLGLRLGPTADVVRTLDMSIWTAPNELHVIRRRIGFLSTMHAAGATNLGERLENDIRKLVRGARTDRIAQMYVAAPEAVKPVYERYFPLRSEPVRKTLERDILQEQKRMQRLERAVSP